MKLIRFKMYIYKNLHSAMAKLDMFLVKRCIVVFDKYMKLLDKYHEELLDKESE